MCKSDTPIQSFQPAVQSLTGLTPGLEDTPDSDVRINPGCVDIGPPVHAHPA